MGIYQVKQKFRSVPSSPPYLSLSSPFLIRIPPRCVCLSFMCIYFAYIRRFLITPPPRFVRFPLVRPSGSCVVPLSQSPHPSLSPVCDKTNDKGVFFRSTRLVGAFLMNENCSFMPCSEIRALLLWRVYKYRTAHAKFALSLIASRRRRLLHLLLCDAFIRTGRRLWEARIPGKASGSPYHPESINCID